ncbi:NAD(P)-dependent dehydrogenase (short-subunit alcohol dehydrogenase family) [Bradyrhizobium sp. CIR48]|nr:NAD(P)-dependent dehydrogenase (short-subunit alcohol dehydrogenase family) [Bradyrhizobium sp. CIR48]
MSAPNLQPVVTDITACSGAGEAAVVDLSDTSTSRVMIDGILSRHRRIDVLVNNAGIFRGGDLPSLSDDDWRLSFAVNLDALFHLCRVILPRMIERCSGAIVNISSQWGLSPAPSSIAYSVTKAAVASFTQNLARDYAPHGMRVNAVCPCETHTPMMDEGLKRSDRTVEDLNKLSHLEALVLRRKWRLLWRFWLPMKRPSFAALWSRLLVRGRCA